MGIAKYILDASHHPVLEPDLLAWARWFEEDGNRIVRQETFGPYFVSTVFLGLDHNWGDGPPILFETMVFVKAAGHVAREDKLEIQARRATWDEALAQHERIAEQIKRSVAN